MNLFRQFWIGLSSYWKAAQLIFSSTMWLAFVIPIMLSIGLYYGGEMITDQLRDYKFSELSDDNGSEYLLLGIQFILVYVTKFMNKYLVLALLAPLLAGLSAQAEKMLTGNQYAFNFKLYLNDIVRALTISGRNMGIQLLLMAAFFIITLIYALPDFVYQALYFVIAFYFYGFSFMDYPSERRRLSVAESVQFTRKHWLAAFTLGAIYGGLFLIPNFDFALEPGVVLAPIFGAVAGTVAVHQIVDLSKNPYALRPETELSEDAESEKD